MLKSSAIENAPRQKPYLSQTMIERRSRILRETRKIINEVGLEGFSIKLICQRSGVAPRTLYNAFGSRDNLIGLAIREMYDSIRDNIQYRTSEITLPGLLDRAIALNRRNLHSRNYALVVAHIYFSSSTSPSLWAVLQGMAVGDTALWLKKIRNRGDLESWIDIDDLTRNMANMEYGLILDWAMGRVSDNEYLRRFAEIILFAALGATRGTTRLEAENFIQRIHSSGEIPQFGHPKIRSRAVRSVET